MNLELFTPAQRIVMIMERICADGMTTTSGGNLSILEENGDIWITPRYLVGSRRSLPAGASGPW